MIGDNLFATSETHTQLQRIQQLLNDAGIELNISRKRVKNINFRLKPYQLSVSAPQYAREVDIITALNRRISWAINQHEQLLQREQQKQQNAGVAQGANAPMMLWGEPYDKHHEHKNDVFEENNRLNIYRHALQTVMPELFDKWQPIVGAYANEQRIKKMKTRWGSCNTRAKRVWLSVYLPAYPMQCTEYVIVHELCHLHHANHSAAFWAEVKKAMPEYKRWHDLLAGKSKLD